MSTLIRRWRPELVCLLLIPALSFAQSASQAKNDVPARLATEGNQPSGPVANSASPAESLLIGTSSSSNRAAQTNSTASQPQSMFDAISGSIRPVETTIEVHEAVTDLETSSPEPFVAGGEDVLTMAGTYGDISRYLQVMPGVVATSDLSNQMLVRGGHPMENLFLVDGIEVPNINHLANANTTGGLGPMIDAAAIKSLRLYLGGFDAKFPERLSSVTELQTLESLSHAKHLEMDVGIQGLGGLVERRISNGDLLISAHRGLLNLVSNNIGIDGVPSYTNELTRFRKNDARGDHLTLLNVAGWDSIEIQPCPDDWVETSAIDSQYSGWRETSGVQWQHVYSNRSFGVIDVSDSEQIEQINQQDQVFNRHNNRVQPVRTCPGPLNIIKATPVYSEDSNNAFSSAKYRYEWGTSRMAFTSGGSVWFQRPHFKVSQPYGAFSPYSAAPVRTDVTSFDSQLYKSESGTYAQFVARPLRALSFSGGARFQTFAFGHHTTATPRLNAAYRFGERAGLNIAYAGYAQLPPYAYLVAYPSNRSMLPMRVTHEIIGMDFAVGQSSTMRLEAYNKTYSDIPASTEYPAVSIHTLLDMLGDQLVWLPMSTKGRGKASGLELSDTSRFGSRFQMQGSVAYSRAKFAGSDGILRPSNFDFPWIANLAAIERLAHGVLTSARFGYATGRPYTPFDLKDSIAQNRPIYDLTKVNVNRAPDYARLDVLLRKEMVIRDVHWELYGGVDNVLNRSNFLSYAWMPRAMALNPEWIPVTTLWQTPIFPNFGIRMIVR
jgi:TonB-dependent Receptor Plug Domain